MYIGVDGCVDGWVTVCYDNEGYTETRLYADIEELWYNHGESAETILIDIPIGLREDSNAKRPCDDVARQKLSPNRYSSVFPVPVRDAVYAESYEAAKAAQERQTDGSLGVQSWNIADKIAQLDAFLRETESDAVGVIREAHPEVCVLGVQRQDGDRVLEDWSARRGILGTSGDSGGDRLGSIGACS
jgi:Uncharacterized conserved protein